ncbi:ATP-binding protein [Cohnella ginsengisoli]|uniref:histidine kinase n=1 Tax=Cohnella ginsengisoli TaxID=425004 RepID=A0A9X4KJM3_9BACL|nr:ATP-binding protein [Cohnella ginsengisoli]MDG0793437.1 ATP-binding protein [Cohnella ginsengisoli]
MREKRLAYTVAVEPDVPKLLRGDRNRLQQILINLIGNAVKFTEKGGIGIRVGLLEETDDRIALEFVVKDTGIGIPASEIDRLFLPFSQADVSTPPQVRRQRIRAVDLQNVVRAHGRKHPRRTVRRTRHGFRFFGAGRQARFKGLVETNAAESIVVPRRNDALTFAPD